VHSKLAEEQKKGSTKAAALHCIASLHTPQQVCLPKIGLELQIHAEIFTIAD